MNLKLNVKKSLTVLALAVFVGTGITSSAAPKKGKEVGLQLYSVRETIKQTDIKSVVEKSGRHGLSNC